MGEHKLNLLGATSLSLVALIGTGMFFGPAIAASYAGTTAILVWLLLGINTIYIAFIFGELVSLFPSAGGIYEFAKQAYGRLSSFFIGWISWLVNTVTTSLLVVAGVEIVAPAHLSAAFRIGFSLLIIILLHFIAYRGLGASEAILDFFAASVLVFIVLTIFVGAPNIDPANYKPLFTASIPAFFIALFFVLETFFGWESACFLAEETNNPRKTIPKAIVISSGVGALLMLVLVIVLYGLFPPSTITQGQDLLSAVFSSSFGSLGRTILVTGMFISLIGSAAGNVISSPRLLLAMARDKLFIDQLGVRSKKTSTPAKAILFQGIVSALIIVFAYGNYVWLLSLMVPLALMMYIPILLAVPVLRHKMPGKRVFSCPLPRIGPVISSAVFLSALIGWFVIDQLSVGVIRFIISLVLFGIPLYLLLSVYYNPSTQLFFSDALAYPALMLENIIIPKRILNKILGLFGDLKGKTVLELGAGVGSLTMHLADEVTKQGRVIAIEAGSKNMKLLFRRIKKTANDHVIPVHDEHIISRIHPSVDRVDAVYSLGMLGYMQDRKKVLKDIYQVLADHGHICFVEWTDYFGLIPDPEWIKNIDDIKDEFASAGFSVHIEKVKGLLWNYLFVYGVKSKKRIPFA